MPNRPDFDFDFGSFLVRASEDVVFIQPVGPMSPAMAQSITQVVQQVKDHYDHYFLLGDLRRASTVHPDARRLLATFGAQNPPVAIALYGGGIVTRGVNALLLGALTWFSKHRPNWMQFEREEEARAWLEKERQRAGFATIQLR